MYLMKINEQQVEQMYYIREDLKSKGIKKPITHQVKEAIEQYLVKQKRRK